MVDFFFQIPWWIPATLALLGVILFLTGNSRADRVLKRAGLGAVLLALLLTLVSYLVDTDREKALARSRAIVEAVNRKDWPALQLLLDDHTTFFSYGNRDQILRAAQSAAQTYGLQSVTLRSIEATQLDTLIEVNLECLSQQTSFPYPLPSAWRFNWIQTGEDWRLQTITLLQIGQQPGPAARRHLPSP